MPRTATNAISQRARVAALTRFRAADDPELIEARAALTEVALLAAIERVIARVPAMRPETRDRLVDLLIGEAAV